MSNRPNINYITGGRLWARGWNRYEGPTMSCLISMLIILTVLGIAAGLVISVLNQFSLELAVATIFVICLIAIFIGIVVAKLVTPLIWDYWHMRDQER